MRHARPLWTKVVTLAESDTCEAQRAQNQAPLTTAVSLPIAEDFFTMLCAENAVWINPASSSTLVRVCGSSHLSQIPLATSDAIFTNRTLSD